MPAAVGAYPGSFDPPTVAHLAIAAAAIRQGGLSRVDLVLSRAPLGKASGRATIEARQEVLTAVGRGRPWLRVVVTDHQLIADVADGYDAVVLGADKWAQVVDPEWYGSTEARDDALRRLPRVLLAPRAGITPPDLPADAVLLDVHRAHGEVSSTGAHEHEPDWMLDEARQSGWWR